MTIVLPQFERLISRCEASENCEDCFYTVVCDDIMKLIDSVEQPILEKNRLELPCKRLEVKKVE